MSPPFLIGARMTLRRDYNPKRQLVDFDTFVARKDESYLMCVSGSMLYALRKLAKTRLLWNTSYATAYDEEYYTIPNETQFDQIDDIVSEWIAASEVVEMCNQALVNALEAISDSIRLSSCCYEGGPGAQQIGDDVYYGTEPPLDEPTSFGPGEEFETEAEYHDHKCEVANGIVNGLVGTLNGVSVLSLVNLTAAAVIAGVVGLGLITVPPLAIIIAVVVAGFAFAGFSTFANAIEDNRETIVCALYQSSSATSAYDTLRANMEDIAIDLGIIEIAINPLLDLIMNIAPVDTMNKLFANVGLPTIGGDTVDCQTLCGECGLSLGSFVFVTGVGEITDSGPGWIEITVQSGSGGGGADQVCAVYHSSVTACCQNWTALSLISNAHSYFEYRCPEGGLQAQTYAQMLIEEERYGFYIARATGLGAFETVIRVEQL